MQRLAQVGNVIALCLAAPLGGVGAAAEPPPSIDRPFRNGGFEEWSADAPSSWQVRKTTAGGAQVTCGSSAVAHGAGQSALVEVAPGVEVSWYGYSQVVSPVCYGQTYRLSYWIKTEAALDGVGAYGGIEFLDDGDERLCFIDSDRFTGTNDWTLVTLHAFVPKGVRAIRANLSLHGHGRAYFDDTQITLVRTAGPLPDGRVALTLAERPAQGVFMGFGVEDDPFLLAGKNLEFAIGDADLALRERRIRAIRPALVRSFLWWDAFNPSRDMVTFVYDSVGMQSLYRLLAVYQALAIPVVITDTHWSWSREQYPYNEQNVERGVAIYLKLLEYLVKERGLTCIRYATITNEPNFFWEAAGGTRASFAQANRLFHERLQQSALKGHLQLIGGDVAMDLNWLQRTIRESDACFSAYSMHFYLPTKQYYLFRDYVERLVETVRQDSKPLGGPGVSSGYKPALILEFGHLPDKHDNGNLADTLRTYEAALWTANANLAVLNQGASGSLLWCLHSLYYGEGFMAPGLWEFKDRQWALRPVYYSQGLCMSLARPGMVPLQVTASTESCEFNAAALRDAGGRVTLFLLNLATGAVSVGLAALPAGEYQVYVLSRDAFAAAQSRPDSEQLDCLASTPLTITATHDLTVPPESFVVLRQR
jgi:hypothetical protein